VPPVDRDRRADASGKGTVAAGVAARSTSTISTAARCIASSRWRRCATACRRRCRRAGRLAQRIAPAFVEGKIIQAARTSRGDPHRGGQPAASQCAVFRGPAALLERQRASGGARAGRRRPRHGDRRLSRRQLKVYLTASVEERAARRHKQLIEKGIPATLTVFCET
jgi:hypothetical protein